ncbi:uncharacterized protein TRAVEDRAFT_30830 [Trametes versicolor FP-101664 SS1]|uniref:uncharacterized protein n=1 Tax=Trametes versicolor (strain FP-101664) TaxID=717944 RepID=UPI0004623006|nr:uncharacterized protein TRAVEDRAFT_30830 [Trametes versicolor FP-101664 SS1]EIW54808.1 hypothetical protein TRAVEDRAFT_30830 [Trametes versicolor FP-101664 SS1]
MASPTQFESGNGSLLLQIDDASPRLQYNGNWVQGGAEQDYQKTSHSSNATGSFVTFTFNGTFITVYGSVDTAGSSSSYKLDDAPPVVTNIGRTSPTQFNYPFFFPSAPLQPGLHELVITVVGGTFSLDYIEYTGGVNGDASQVSSSSSSSSSSGGTASPDSAPPTASPSKGLSAGAIAGIAVAAIGVVLIVALTLFYVRRRSARRVRHRRHIPEKGIDVLFDAPPKEPPTAEIRSPFRRLSRIYRPTPARSAQSSKTATSSAPTSITQSSAMFTSVIMLSPALSVVSEESGPHDISRRVSGS